MDSIKPGELLVGGSNLFIRGGPGDVKKVVELIIHRFAILLKTKKNSQNMFYFHHFQQTCFTMLPSLINCQLTVYQRKL